MVITNIEFLSDFIIGKLFSWGMGGTVLGHSMSANDTEDILTPRQVKIKKYPNMKYLSVSAGSHHIALIGFNDEPRSRELQTNGN